jgi:hypothetical protein
MQNRIDQIVSICKQLPLKAQQEILDYAKFVAENYRAKRERRKANLKKRNEPDDPPLYRWVA